MVLGEGFGGHGHGFNFERSDDAKIRNVRPTFYFKVVVEGLVFRFDAWAFSFRGMSRHRWDFPVLMMQN